MIEIEKNGSQLSRTHSWGVYWSVKIEWHYSLFFWSTEHDRSWMGRWSRCRVFWCHQMYQSIVVAKLMWRLAGNWYPLRAKLLVCELDNTVDLISIKVTLKTISWYDTPRADRRRDRRKRLLTCRSYQTWCGIHYHISPSEDVTCHFTLLRVLIILHHI